MKAILSPHMLLLKFPTHSGIGQVRGDQLSARICYVSSTEESATRASRQKMPEMLTVTCPSKPNDKGGTERPDDPRDDNVMLQAQPTEELETISISDTQDRHLPQSVSPSRLHYLFKGQFGSFRLVLQRYAWHLPGRHQPQTQHLPFFQTGPTEEKIL
ncbi:unnamed protein product [Prunus armeniaca]